MPGEISALLSRIEELREQMQKSAVQKGLSDLEVLAIIQKLDRVLNDFYKLSA